jgi:hypothetical protein
VNMSKLSHLIGCLYLCILSNIVQSQDFEVTASVDKNPVMVDESFILTITANQDLDRNAFDSSFLMKDFVVGRTSISSQTQMVNFTTSKKMTWSTVLIPRKQGRFAIPALDISGFKTQAIDMMVLPVSANTAAKVRDLFITTKVDVEQAYLQQQIRYTVKLHLGKDLQRGSLSSPTLENADIRQIGKDKEYNEVVDGRRYRIIERAFAIIAQQSGTFTIEGPLFEGEIINNTQESFGFFNRRKAVNRVGPSQSITVLPIPSNYDQHWLPSEFVQLDDEWQGDGQRFIAGEPITRTITLTAIGVVEEQLPEISSIYPDSVKFYPDQAETTTVEKDQTLVAQRKESIAIIPSESGELAIPEVKIPWFNTLTQKTEFAILPKKVLQIMPAIEQASAVIPISQNTTNSVFPDTIQNTAHAEQITNDSYVTYWQWLSLALIILWAFTLVLWRRHVKKLISIDTNGRSSVVRNSQSEQLLWKSLEKALIKHDTLATQECLSLWLGTLLEQKKASLSSSVELTNDPTLSQEVHNLLAARYAKNQIQWQSQNLHKVLRRIRKDKITQGATTKSLSALYPVS